MTAGCSGALISENVVLTAAHCVVNGGQNMDPGYQEKWYNNTVIPGMDRNADCSEGNTDAACKLRPFGEVNVETALVPEGWLVPQGNNGGGFHQHDPYEWVDDIAVLTLEQPVGQQTGVFDYRALSAYQLTNAAFLNRGYPSPFANPKPLEYEPWAMYGQDKYCFIIGFAAEVDGIHKIVRHECDTSGGHSGSPIYQWRISSEGTRPEIAAIVSHHASGRNYARRIVSSDAALIDMGISMGQP